MGKTTLAVLYGGNSTEHEISIITALQLMDAVDTFQYELIPVYNTLSGEWWSGHALRDRNSYPNPGRCGAQQLSTPLAVNADVYLLAFHGQYGEDGCIQGMLEYADVPYIGSPPRASALAMDKYLSKSIAYAHDVPVLPGQLARKSEVLKNFVEERDRVKGEFPLFVKPNHLGSSVGIAKATTTEELGRALAGVFRYDDYALVEPYVSRMMEVNISVMEGDPPVASVVEIPIPTEEVLSYDDKYLRGGKNKSAATPSGGMDALLRTIDPSDLDPSIKAEVTRYALELFHVFGLAGVVRFDFILDLDKDQLYFNEVNAIPGSFAYYLWEKSHPQLLYTDLVDRLVQGALKRYRDKGCLKKEFGFRALKTI